MSKTSRLPARHGLDHVPGGYDPIPVEDPVVVMAPRQTMGACLPHARLANGLGLNGGVLWVPISSAFDEGATPPETGEVIRGYLAFAEPGPGHFDWIAMRTHFIPCWADNPFLGPRIGHSNQYTNEPWQSSPWSGGSGTGGTAASFDLAPLGGNWQGYFYGICGVSDDDADTVHFETPGGEIDRDEDYGWDVAGVGHIGYIFHDFDTSETDDLTISFASGSGPEKAAGFVRNSWVSGVTPVAVGAVYGESTAIQTAIASATLTDDMTDGSALIVVTATQGPAGFMPSDATSRPVVENRTRREVANSVPQFFWGGEYYEIFRDIGGMGQAGDDIDGGSP